MTPTAAVPRDVAALVRAVEQRNDGYRQAKEHHAVTLSLPRAGGGWRHQRCTGVLALRRPDALRLVAVLPAGITLFDLQVRGGHPRVLRRLGRAGATRLDRALRRLGGDLMRLYRLGRWRLSRERWRRASGDGETLVLASADGSASLRVDRRTLVVRAASFDGGALRARYLRPRQHGPRLVRPHRVHLVRKGRDGYRLDIEVRRLELEPPLDRRLFARRGAAVVRPTHPTYSGLLRERR